MHNNKSAYSASLYVDEHGEEDPGLRRGRPLFLNDARYRALELLWRQQGIPREVAQIRSTSDRVIRDNCTCPFASFIYFYHSSKSDLAFFLSQGIELNLRIVNGKYIPMQLLPLKLNQCMNSSWQGRQSTRLLCCDIAALYR
jgi:hypothetical protein